MTERKVKGWLKTVMGWCCQKIQIRAASFVIFVFLYQLELTVGYVASANTSVLNCQVNFQTMWRRHNESKGTPPPTASFVVSSFNKLNLAVLPSTTFRLLPRRHRKNLVKRWEVAWTVRCQFSSPQLKCNFISWYWRREDLPEKCSIRNL